MSITPCFGHAVAAVRRMAFSVALHGSYERRPYLLEFLLKLLAQSGGTSG